VTSGRRDKQIQVYDPAIAGKQAIVQENVSQGNKNVGNVHASQNVPARRGARSANGGRSNGGTRRQQQGAGYVAQQQGASQPRHHDDDGNSALARTGYQQQQQQQQYQQGQQGQQYEQYQPEQQ
jgi:hypothetical protein